METFLKSSLAGTSACLVATAALNPLEVIKIQIQRDHHLHSSLIRTGWKIFIDEGYWYGLMKPGLLASCSREIFYSSFRFAIYPQLRSMLAIQQLHSNSQSRLGLDAFLEKFGAGLVAGAIGSSIANPADLIKIRMQSEPGRVGADGRFLRGDRVGQSRSYKSTLDALMTIIRQDGIRGLYRGIGATCIRSSFLTAGQLSSYDHTKQILKSKGILNEGIPLHITASIISGLMAATCCAPADRVKTMMMLQTTTTSRTNINPSFSFKDALVHIWKTEGIKGLYRGWTPSYFRLAPHFIISLPLNEQFRSLLGLDAF